MLRSLRVVAGVALLALCGSVLACVVTGCTSPRSPSDRADSVSTDELDAGSEQDDAGSDVSPGMQTGTAGSTGSDASCGDGNVSGTERCDVAIAAGMPGACPASCPSTDTCKPAALRGTGCDARCEGSSITARIAGDACCPTGASASEDADCASTCGNGIREARETCDPPGSCPACPASSACVTVSASGSAAECTATCSSVAVTECRSGDGCCPSGCTSASDSDCSMACGNGRIDPGETCEKNADPRCPASCDDGNACTTDTRSGSEDECNVVCAHVALPAGQAGDGCCPAGASSGADADCAPVCGNAVQEAGETCDDGNMVAGDGCNPSCALETQAPLTCAQAQAAGDRCTLCACSRCGGEGRACSDVRASPARRAGCRALAACIRVNDCSNIDCYCGPDLVSCASGMPTGPCRAEVEATVGSDNILQIVQQLQDDRSPLYRAVQQSACEVRQCGAVCGD